MRVVVASFRQTSASGLHRSVVTCARAKFTASLQVWGDIVSPEIGQLQRRIVTSNQIERYDP